MIRASGRYSALPASVRSITTLQLSRYDRVGPPVQHFVPFCGVGIVLQTVLTPLVKERHWVDRILAGAAIVVDLVKGGAEAFIPLKATLECISVVCANYQVCFTSLFRSLSDNYPEHCCCEGQD